MTIKKIEDFSYRIYDYLRKNNQKIKKTIIISHNNTDIDGLGSVLGLYYLLQNIPFINSEDLILYLPSINQVSKKILTNLSNQDYHNIQNIENKITSQDILIIVLDTNKLEYFIQDIVSLEQIFSIIIIDHHEKPNFLDKENNHLRSNNDSVLMEKMKEKINLSLIQPSASSCSELVGAIWNDWDQKSYILYEDSKDGKFTSEFISQLLLLGIFSDSASLKFSKNWVMPIINFLINKGANLEKLYLLGNNQQNQDEKIAKIKGAIRSEQPIVIENYIILFTNANSFESSICNSLIQLGADVAFCFSTQGRGKFRIIVRSSDNFQANTNINFGKFMESLAEIFSGFGGGHKGAAGLNGLNPPENIKDTVIQKLKKEINSGNL